MSDIFSTPPTQAEAANAAPVAPPSGVQLATGHMDDDNIFGRKPTDAELAAAAPHIVEAQSPALTDEERISIGRLGLHPDQTAAYIAKTHPELNVRLYDDPGVPPTLVGEGRSTNVAEPGRPAQTGRILLQNKDAGPNGTWFPVVPHGWKDGEISKTIAEQLPALTGAAAQYGGGALGAAAGAMTGPLAPFAIPALTALGGGAGSALNEAGRQLLGRIKGINSSMDPGAIGTSGLFGTIGSLFGGAPGKAQPLGPELFEALPQGFSGTGLAGKGLDKAAEVLGSMAPGKVSGAIAKTGRYGGAALGAAKGAQSGLMSILEHAGYGAGGGEIAGRTLGALIEGGARNYSPNAPLPSLFKAALGPAAASATQAVGAQPWGPWRSSPTGP